MPHPDEHAETPYRAGFVAGADISVQVADSPYAFGTSDREAWLAGFSASRAVHSPASHSNTRGGVNGEPGEAMPFAEG